MNAGDGESVSAFESSGDEHEQEEDGRETKMGMHFPESFAGFGVNPELYRCKTPFYSFTQASHHLMVSCVVGCRYATAAEIEEADPNFIGAVGRDKSRKVAGIEGRWKVFQDRLQVQIDVNGHQQLHFKTTPEKFIAHTGQWQQIVQMYHADAQNRHFGVSGTLERTRQVWITDTRRHGIPELYVQAYIAQCPICNPTSQGANSALRLEGKRLRPPKFNFPVQLEVSVKMLPQKLEALAIEHKVVLRVLHSKRIAPCPLLSEVISYICHRGQFKRVREKREGPISEKRRCRTSFRCGCNFRIKTLIPITNYSAEGATYDYEAEGMALILLNPVHSGHEPGSELDCLHLPVHPSAIWECEESRGDMKDLHAITRASLRRAPLLKAQASQLEQATFRFYLTKKETQRLPYNRKLKDKLAKDNAEDVHLRYNELAMAEKTASNQLEHSVGRKDKLPLASGVADSRIQCMPTRRLGFQKVLARLADSTHASALLEQQSLDLTEGDASVYYSKPRQGGNSTGKFSACRMPLAQSRWLKEVEYLERHGRDLSRLEIVNKGISQFHRLHLSEEMDTDVVDTEQPVEEARNVMSHELHELEKELGTLKQRAGELSFEQMSTATNDLKSCRQALIFLGGVEESCIAPNERTNLSRPVRVHYISTQSDAVTEKVRDDEGIFFENDVAKTVTTGSSVQTPRPQSGPILKNSDSDSRKRKRIDTPLLNKLPCTDGSIHV